MTQINVRNGSRPAPVAPRVPAMDAMAAVLAEPVTQEEIDAAKPLAPIDAADAQQAAKLATDGMDAITDALIREMESTCRRVEEGAAEARRIVEEFKAKHEKRGREIIDDLTSYATDTAEFSTLVRSLVERGNRT